MRPFPCWIIDDFLPEAASLYQDVALAEWEASYDNDCEKRKRTCRVAPPRIDETIRRLCLDSPLISSITGLSGLFPDPTLHGAGLHIVDPGGWLVQHIDYALHPKVEGAWRRANLVVFLNPEWKEQWGGAFELGDAVGTVVERVYPVPGRAVVWLPSDTAFHGTQRVADDAPPRATLAVYYLHAEPPPPGARRRALFIPNRGTVI